MLLLAAAAALLRLNDFPETDDLLSLVVREGREEERDLSLKWVSRCCFMLSARVNFLGQPLKEHGTAFSAV
jgi:hypothetical protein